MYDAAGFLTAEGAFIVAGIRLTVWMAMLYVPLRLAGIRIREALLEISQPEAIFYGLYSVGAALAVGSLFS